MIRETVFLVDNGSLEPPATLSLRRLASALSERTGVTVEPVSIRHSNRIPPEQVDGLPAEVVEEALAKRAAEGVQRVTVVPLFFGPSGALTSYLPEVARRFPQVEVRVCPTLHRKRDARLAQILATNILGVAIQLGTAPAPRAVAIVDHGSPARELTAVRDALASEVARMLGEGFKVAPSSMERREGAEYDFNEPLLATLLATPPWNSGDVIVAMQFLQPGRHAGPGGDVATICRDAEEKSPGLRTHMTALVGESPLLIEILADRLTSAFL
ncbi:MAG TPA: CbiX/SirB N-terminal domain-containing protein [Opitutaceae bacterium]